MWLFQQKKISYSFSQLYKQLEGKPNLKFCSEIATCLLLQSSTTTFSGLRVRMTLSTSTADCIERWFVPISQIASGSTNSVLHDGTGPNWFFLMRNRVPLSAKSSNSGWVCSIASREVLKYSFLKLKLGGGGFMATLHWWNLVLGNMNLEWGGAIGKGEVRILMAGAKRGSRRRSER